jgi:esterase/lipase
LHRAKDGAYLRVHHLSSAEIVDSQVESAYLDLDHDLEVRRSTYEWSKRVFRILQKILKVNLKLHQSGNQINDGDIFLFNHFARFETFIPQYLIYSETGATCRSVAASEFFAKDDPFSNYLLNAGAVPHDLPNLLPFLAAEILRGQKVIVFPEGGMVKDRRVLDHRGKYSVYSRSSKERRKHHTGPAVLGIALDVFKQKILHAHRDGQARQLDEWTKTLQLDDVDQLLAAARRPTVIVPANITFYPIRVSDNMLRKIAELLNRGLSRRLSEELLIEGNILLKHTDMDVRLGEGIYVSDYWRYLDKKVLAKLSARIDSLEDAFSLGSATAAWDTRLMSRRMRRNVLKVRDEYMRRMYSNVTVNLSHLASHLVLELVDRGRIEIDKDQFHKMLYITVKQVQRAESVHLHRSLRNPDAYTGLLDTGCDGLSQFLRTTTSMELLKSADGIYSFLPKLREEHAFDEIRLENLVAVYANEVEPIDKVHRAVTLAIRKASKLSDRELALMRFDDELVAFTWDKAQFSKPRHASINEREIATADPTPFLFKPRLGSDTGVVLVHGFLASPAEVREFGEKLADHGHPVLGVRLKGHGTSPWDLRDRSWLDWLASVRRGYAIMAELAERVVLVGFSTGGALCLRLASEQPKRLAGVAAIAVPLKFRNKNMVFVPLMHGANNLVRWASSYEGIVPFRANDASEQPDINYRQMPIRGLYELRQMVSNLEDQLENVRCPALLLHGNDDPVAVPDSAEHIYDSLPHPDKAVKIVTSSRHGILKEDIGDTQQLILDFIKKQSLHEELPTLTAPPADDIPSIDSDIEPQDGPPVRHLEAEKV